jgi:hypothetical protein
MLPLCLNGKFPRCSSNVCSRQLSVYTLPSSDDPHTVTLKWNILYTPTQYRPRVGHSRASFIRQQGVGSVLPSRHLSFACIHWARPHDSFTCSLEWACAKFSLQAIHCFDKCCSSQKPHCCLHFEHASWRKKGFKKEISNWVITVWAG